MGTKKLDHMLSLGVPTGNRRGLGFDKSNITSSSKTMFVPARF